MDEFKEQGREADLLWRFKKSGKLSGWFIREVPVGLFIRGRPPMRIDAICVEGDPPRFLVPDKIPMLGTLTSGLAFSGQLFREGACGY
ncbi:MAG: hypothetical protein DRJ51_07075 [Thermoprotei archaeon]|nr:MAG: hypothetical protein DRJ51_07075 [Thermoprotei archaeon]